MSCQGDWTSEGLESLLSREGEFMFEVEVMKCRFVSWNYKATSHYELITLPLKREPTLF